MQLWVGTHPSGESYVFSDDVNDQFNGLSLSQVLQTTPEYVGTIQVVKSFRHDLPFILKVLSVAEPLSIQSHPDKSLASRLHSSDAKNYPDANHKPEMAIAITPFQALCSFRPHLELQEILSRLEPLKDVIATTAIDDYLKASPETKDESLRKCFTSLVTADSASSVNTIQQLKQYFYKKQESSALSSLENDLLKVLEITSKFYPDDVGCLCALFLNYIQLEPGQAVFLKANEPHCYLFGDCVECMAKSDNVIRLGLTPKYRDINSICSSLSYKPVPVADLILEGKVNSLDTIISCYPSYTQDFVVERIKFSSLGAINQEFVLKPKSSGSILLVLEGKFIISEQKLIAQAGCVFFIPAMLPITLVSLDSHLLCFRAAINI